MPSKHKVNTLARIAFSVPSVSNCKIFCVQTVVRSVACKKREKLGRTEGAVVREGSLTSPRNAFDFFNANRAAVT